MPVLFLSTCNLYFVPELLQHLRHALTVLPLNFDHTILYGSARPAFLLQLFGERLQVLFGEDEVLYDRHHLPAAPARLAVQVSGLLSRWQGLDVGCSLFFPAKVTFIRRPDGTVIVGHGAIIANQKDPGKISGSFFDYLRQAGRRFALRLRLPLPASTVAGGRHLLSSIWIRPWAA